MKNVLVINFKSPPFQGIGGRRWSKISKGLINKSINVHVIHAKWISGHVPEHFCNGKSISLNLQHPIRRPHSWLKKINDKKEFWRRRFNSDYTFFDEGAYSIEFLKDGIRQMMGEQNIDWVFVSCPPYSWTYETVKLIKEEFNHVQVWVDLRDPWLTANNWGIPGLTQKQRISEEERHRFVGQMADIISSPAIEILQEFENCQHPKFVHLKHFYDADDFPENRKDTSQMNAARSWVYAGQFYVGMESYAQQLGLFANQNSGDQILLFSKDVDRFQDKTKGYLNIKLSKEQGSKVFEEVSQCFGLILMLAEYNKDFFTTKFFDYLPYEKPIAYFGPDGKVKQFLKKNGEQMTSFLPFEVYSLKGYDISQDELSFRVEQILNLCQSNPSKHLST
ncbi:MAG: hypothetical protein RL106_1016 [Bacteroidota bacterium]|jgi:hypothetical protein